MRVCQSLQYDSQHNHNKCDMTDESDDQHQPSHTVLQIHECCSQKSATPHPSAHVVVGAGRLLVVIDYTTPKQNCRHWTQTRVIRIILYLSRSLSSFVAACLFRFLWRPESSSDSTAMDTGSLVAPWMLRPWLLSP